MAWHRVLIDCVAWACALAAVQLLRADFDGRAVVWRLVVVTAVWVAVVQWSAGSVFHLYQGRFRTGSLEEAKALAVASAVTAFLASMPVAMVGPELGIPRSAVVLAWPAALLAMWSVRCLVRQTCDARCRPADAARALVFGAGQVGGDLVRRLLTAPDSPFLPVALIDDDPAKHNARIRHLKVMGGLDELDQIARDTDASVLLVAIADANAALLRRASDAARRCGLAVKVAPPLEQVLNGGRVIGDLRDLSIEDLIGRQPVDTNVDLIAGYLTGRRVLVTGAGGSIGLELCRQIHRFGPAELIMLDRDETGLQAAELAIHGHGLLNGPDVVLADIRDRATIMDVFRSRRPQVVFHAAALKHLPMLQQYPVEAWKTNVIGTRNVLEAARAVGTGVFINISTDKAANPTSVLGHSKRLAERLTAWMAQQTGRSYLSVRFGNVIGSRGSMLPLFTKLIQDGGPVTVTHPEVTRYFMTIPEACQLVVQAGGIGKPGEVLILDMGDPVRVLDIANRMIEMSGRTDVEIVFTGLREGEKLHEDLLFQGEVDERPSHRKISHARVPGLPPEELDLERSLVEWITTCTHPVDLAAASRFAESAVR